MPTILINTNLNSSVLRASDDEHKNKDSLDAEFRQDLNAIITKLLAKSETMESFTIKYDIDDLGGGSSGGGDTSEKSNTAIPASCICHRMARLFADLLSPKHNTSDHEKSVNQRVEEEPAAGGRLDSILREIKLLRKYQFDLDAKFNLLLTKLTYGQQQQASSVATATLATMASKQPHLAINSLLKQQQQNQQHPMRMNNGCTLVNTNAKSSSNHHSLTGAKKRKFNSNNLFGHTNNKSRSPSSSSSSTSTASSSSSGGRSNQSGSNTVPSKDPRVAPRQHPSQTSMHQPTTTSPSSSNSSQNQKSGRAVEDINDPPVTGAGLNTQLEHNGVAEDSRSAEVEDAEGFFKNERAEPNDDIDHNNDDINNELNDDEIEEAGIDLDELNDDGDDEDDECLELAAAENNDDEFAPDYDEDNVMGDDPNNDESNQFGAKMNLSSQQLAHKINLNNRTNKLPLSVAVQNHLKSTQLGYLNYIYQQQPHGLSGSTKPSNMTGTNHHHHHNQNHQNRLAFNMPSQDVFPSHLSHNNSSAKALASYHHQNHHQASSASASGGSSMAGLVKSHAASSLSTPSTNFSNMLSQQQQQQQTQQSLNQAIDIDINELFKGNGPKYLQLESYKNFKAPITKSSDGKYFVEDTMAALSYSKSKSRRNFAAHLTKLVFTPRERLESNCNGRFGKKALDSVRLLAIRNTIFKYYPCKQSTVIVNGDAITSGDSDENSVWVRDCIPAIDESNRVLKKQLVAWYKKNNPDKFPAGYKMECSFSSGAGGGGLGAGAYHGHDFDEDEFDEQE